MQRNTRLSYMFGPIEDSCLLKIIDTVGSGPSGSAPTLSLTMFATRSLRMGLRGRKCLPFTVHTTPAVCTSARRNDHNGRTKALPEVHRLAAPPTEGCGRQIRARASHFDHPKFQ